MSQTAELRHQESIDVAADAESLYEMLTDIGRTGEWSPVCISCWWEDTDQAGAVGAWFVGRNEQPDRTWETRSLVVVADRPHEFAWVVGGGFVRWGYTFTPVKSATRVIESWEFLPEGIAMFEKKYGDRAPVEIAARTAAAFDGIPKTLAAIKRIAEESTGSSENQ